jgi:hypothetical protein
MIAFKDFSGHYWQWNAAIPVISGWRMSLSAASRSSRLMSRSRAHIADFASSRSS